MRIIFFGTPEYTIHYLELLAKHCSVEAVISAPDAPAGRGCKNKTPAPVIWAKEQNIRHMQPASLQDPEFQSALQSIAPDCGIVIAYGKLIPEAVFSTPKLGCFNLHFSLLPKFRGASPIESTLLCGDNAGGVTIQKITKELDAGDILCTSAVPVSHEDHFPELFEKLLSAGSELLLTALNLLRQGTFTLTPQNNDDISICRKIQTATRQIHWENSAEDILGLIRAFSGHRTAYCSHKGSRILIHRAALAESCPKAAPGTIVLADKNHLRVACREGGIDILELQPGGKKKIDYRAFLNGYQLISGAVFE